MDLQYKNLRIRNASVSDAAQLCAWWNDGEVMAHAGFPLGLGITEESIITKLLQETDDTTRRHIIEDDGLPIGEMNYRQLDPDTCEMGIKICVKDRQNKGLGRLILSLFIDGLFRERKYKKICLDTNLENKRAKHVYELLGFQKIAVHMNSWQDQLGQNQSAVVYELTEATFHSYLTNAE